MDTWIRGDTNRVQVTVTDNGGTTSLVGATIKAALSAADVAALTTRMQALA